jgi:hypothetical protein
VDTRLGVEQSALTGQQKSCMDAPVLPSVRFMKDPQVKIAAMHPDSSAR